MQKFNMLAKYQLQEMVHSKFLFTTTYSSHSELYALPEGVYGFTGRDRNPGLPLLRRRAVVQFTLSSLFFD